jgi:hypothetical protein
MEFYSAIKKIEILSFVGEWMELKIIMLGEESQVLPLSLSLSIYICVCVCVCVCVHVICI